MWWSFIWYTSQDSCSSATFGLQKLQIRRGEKKKKKDDSMFDVVLLKKRMIYVHGNVLCLSLSCLIPLVKANSPWYFKLAYRLPPLNLTPRPPRKSAAVKDVRSYLTDQQTRANGTNALKQKQIWVLVKHFIHARTEINLGICLKRFKMKWLLDSIKELLR